MMPQLSSRSSRAALRHLSRRLRPAGLVCACVLAAAVAVVRAADTNWPQLRGSAAGTAADHPDLPDRWSQTENVLWSVDVPGRSWSSPIVWGDHVFVTSALNTTGTEPPLKAVSAYSSRSLGGPMTGADLSKTADQYRWMIYDFDFRSGKVRWQRVVHAAVPRETVHQKSSFAPETPVTDGERVYVYFGHAGLFAFDMAGTPLWSKPMPVLKVRTGWGSAASPVVHQGRVYIVNDNEEQSFIAAFEGRTGKELWRVTRDEGSNWTTPFVWEAGGRTEIVTAGTQKVRSYDRDGRLLWELKGMSTIAIPTPFAHHGLLYVTSGYPPDQLRPVYAIRPGASGDISLKPGETSNASIAWSLPTAGPYNPSPLVYRDRYYTLLDRGFLTSHDAKTGTEIYGRQRIAADSAGFTASPWAYNGKVFALSEDGDTFVMESGPEFKVVGRNSLGEMSMATPAVAGGSLIIRTASKLYRISNRPSR